MGRTERFFNPKRLEHLTKKAERLAARSATALLLIGLLVLLSDESPPAPDCPPSPQEVLPGGIYLQDADLYVDGERFLALGLNNYALGRTHVGGERQPTPKETDDLLDTENSWVQQSFVLSEPCR